VTDGVNGTVPREAPRQAATLRTHLALTRHGETVWHADNRYAGGGSDVDLTELGKQQADALAEWVRGQHFDAVVVSPVRRALETAAPSAAALGVDMEIIDDLRELHFGVAEGRTVEELADLDADMVDRFRADPVKHPFPGSESPARAADRAAAALRGVAAAHAGGRVLVVAHNTLLRLAMCALLELPVARYRSLFPRLDNAAITELSVPVDPARPASLLSLNSRPSRTP
jgi:probable phosphoglycerate mutase